MSMVIAGKAMPNPIPDEEASEASEADINDDMVDEEQSLITVRTDPKDEYVTAFRGTDHYYAQIQVSSVTAIETATETPHDLHGYSGDVRI
ncbi:MAG: hypothetical protein M1836_001755 [Candelina mexicana]|nr:MAG: hypothetical protein M1836_001755 [Candelina mexicana]